MMTPEDCLILDAKLDEIAAERGTTKAALIYEALAKYALDESEFGKGEEE